MNSRYRIVHFVPDPIIGGRVPIAAFVEHEGRVSVARAPHLPGPTCLGGRRAAALVHMMLEDLEDAEGFDQLPASLGPHAVLGRPAEVPRGVEDAVLWITSKLFVGAAADFSHVPERYQSPRRSTFGYRFFQTHRVDRYVRKTFNPGVNAEGFLPEAAALGEVTHYVEGDREVLLLEPVLPARNTWEEDTQEVARTFAAYQTALRKHREHDRRRSAELTAYILAGGASHTREEISRRLSAYGRVVDTSHEGQRASFLMRIRETGRSGRDPLLAE